MGSNLNSVMLEGIIKDSKLKLNKKCNMPFVSFTILNYRYNKITNKILKNHFDIYAFDRCAENVIKFCLKGMGVRVVGELNEVKTLKNQKVRNVVVLADHIEFREQPKKTEKKKSRKR